MLRLFAFLFLFFVTSTIVAQAIFSLDSLHTIRIVFKQADFSKTMSHHYKDHVRTRDIPYIPAKVSIDGVEVDSVGLRYKGASSYKESMSKKSLKLDFNKFINGQKFQKLRKLNLHNSYADPSFMRDALSYHLFREMGVRAPRVSYAKVFINEEYVGVYQVVEQIDKTFTKGSLFKNMGWDNLKYKNNGAAIYRKKIDLKGKDEYAKWVDFIQLLKVISSSENGDFEDKLEAVFDVDIFLRALVVYVATNNYDSVLKTGRNWYLNQRTDSSKFEWIPWDTNFSFGAIHPQAKDCNKLKPDFCAFNTGRKVVQFVDRTVFSSKIGYSWDFGDGSSSEERDSKHKFKKNQNYEVCLTATIKDICSEQYCETINLKVLQDSCFASDRPSADFEFDFFATLSTNDFVQKVLVVPSFRLRYQNLMCSFLKENFNIEKLDSFISQRYDLLQDAMKKDVNLLNSLEEFEKETSMDDYKYSLRRFIIDRNTELSKFDHCK